jgi:hypothetical protein
MRSAAVNGVCFFHRFGGALARRNAAAERAGLASPSPASPRARSGPAGRRACGAISLELSPRAASSRVLAEPPSIVGQDRRTRLYVKRPAAAT